MLRRCNSCLPCAGALKVINKGFCCAYCIFKIPLSTWFFCINASISFLTFTVNNDKAELVLKMQINNKLIDLAPRIPLCSCHSVDVCGIHWGVWVIASVNKSNFVCLLIKRKQEGRGEWKNRVLFERYPGPNRFEQFTGPVMKERRCCSCCVCLCDRPCAHERRTWITANEKKNKAVVRAFRWSTGDSFRVVCVCVCVCVRVCVWTCVSAVSHGCFIWSWFGYKCLAASVSYCPHVDARMCVYACVSVGERERVCVWGDNVYVRCSTH